MAQQVSLKRLLPLLGIWLMLVASPETRADAPLSVVAVYLVNAETGEDIRLLEPHAVLNLSTLPTRRLNLRAIVKGSSVKDVTFGYDQRAVVRTESSAPYALAGDKDGKFNPWTPSLGAHTLTVTARGQQVSAASARGRTRGGGAYTTSARPLVIPFKVIDEPRQQKAPTRVSAALEPTSMPTPLTPTAPTALRPSYRIKAGGKGFVDMNGTVWQADTGLSSNASYGEQALTRDLLGNALYLSGRNSSIEPVKFHLPLPSGEYLLILHFMELYGTTPGLSIFDVAVEGRVVAERLDIVREVGFRQPLRLMRTTTVTDGALDLMISPIKGVASLSGIEVSPARP
jgi:hypothetical protein